MARKRYRLADPMPLCLLALVLVGTLAYTGAFGIGEAPGRSQVHRARVSSKAVRPVPVPRRPLLQPTPSLKTVAARYNVSATVLVRVLRFRSVAERAWKADAPLVLSVIAAESKGNPAAVNENNPENFDLGLMQVNTANFSATGLTWQSAVKPVPNIRAGTAILKADVGRYGVPYGLEVYNAGPSGIGRDWTYVDRVESWTAPIRALLGGNKRGA